MYGGWTGVLDDADRPLFAIDVRDGKRLWIATVNAGMAGHRTRAIAVAESGSFAAVDGPGWATSLVAAEGVVIAPGCDGAGVSLIGFDAATGERRWTLPKAIGKYATPNTWRHGNRTHLLAATLTGAMRLIDPRDGSVRWTVEGLGANWTSLMPSPVAACPRNCASPPAPMPGQSTWP